MMSDTTEIQQQQTIGNDAITEEQQVTMAPLQDKIPGKFLRSNRSRSSGWLTSELDTNANNDNDEQSLSPGSSIDRQDSEPPVHPLNTPISMARLPVLETKPSSSSSFADQTDASVEEITVSDMEQDNDQDTQQVPSHDDTCSIPTSQPEDTLINDISIKQEDSTLDTLMGDQPSFVEEYGDDSKDALPPCDPELLKSIRETTSDDIWGPHTDDDLPTGMKITRDLFNEYTVDDSNESSLMHDQLFQLLINTTDLDDAIHQQADDIIQKYRQHNNDDDDGISDHDDDMGSDDEDMLDSDQDNMGSYDQEHMISDDNEDYENNDYYHNNEYNHNDENDELLSD